MASKKEIAAITALAATEWRYFQECLTSSGQVWPNTDSTRWHLGTQSCFANFRAYAKVLEILTGKPFTRIADEIEAAHEAAQETKKAA